MELQTHQKAGLVQQLRAIEAKVDSLSEELYRIRHPTDVVPSFALVVSCHHFSYWMDPLPSARQNPVLMIFGHYNLIN